MLAVMETILIAVFTLMAVTFWMLFLYTSIRDDIRREKERKVKLQREKEFEKKYSNEIF